MMIFQGFAGGSLVKNLANAGDGDWIPGVGRFPGEGKATHFSIRAWRIPWTEEPDGPWAYKELDTT